MEGLHFVAILEQHTRHSFAIEYTMWLGIVYNTSWSGALVLVS